MIVSDVINQLTASEIKPLVYSQVFDSTTEPSIREGLEITMLNLVNNTLVEIYKELPQLTREVVFDVIVGTELYYLPEDFRQAISCSTDTNEIIPINHDRGDDFSILIPDPKVVIVKGEIPEGVTQFSIVYSIYPSKVTQFDEELPLGTTYLTPFISYLAYKCFQSVGGESNMTVAKGFFAKYLNDIANIKQLGLEPIQYIYNDKLLSRGFV